MLRVLKGFACWIAGNEDEPSIEVAETSSKARAAYWRYLSDCYPDLKIHQVGVRRSPAHDMTFPDLPSAASGLDQRARDIVVHMYGGGSHIRPEQWGYRDHYCGAADHPVLTDLVHRGLATGPHGGDGKGGTGMWVGAFFYLTAEGKTAARSLIGEREAPAREAMTP